MLSSAAAKEKYDLFSVALNFKNLGIIPGKIIFGQDLSSNAQSIVLLFLLLFNDFVISKIKNQPDICRSPMRIICKPMLESSTTVLEKAIYSAMKYLLLWRSIPSLDLLDNDTDTFFFCKVSNSRLTSARFLFDNSDILDDYLFKYFDIKEHAYLEDSSRLTLIGLDY